MESFILMVKATHKSRIRIETPNKAAAKKIQKRNGGWVVETNEQTYWYSTGYTQSAILEDLHAETCTIN